MLLNMHWLRIDFVIGSSRAMSIAFSNLFVGCSFAELIPDLVWAELRMIPHRLAKFLAHPPYCLAVFSALLCSAMLCLGRLDSSIVVLYSN
jgi:hypothetical protein